MEEMERDLSRYFTQKLLHQRQQKDLEIMMLPATSLGTNIPNQGKVKILLN